MVNQTSKIRIATFNVENLFARYNFGKNIDPLSAGAVGFLINELAFTLHDDDSKKITAKAIKETKADVVCLQEVENMGTLERFVSRYLGGQKYKYKMLIDSHDPRKIDVAVISKLPIVNTRIFRHERNAENTAWLFSRDCLEVTVKKDSKELTLYNNHFKSMVDGRDETKEKRKSQAERVADIIDERWGKNNYKGNFVVLGDFNDYVDSNTSLTALTQHQGLENILLRISSEDDRWTHYWAGGNKYKQIDFILLGKELAEKNKNEKPVIVRKGLPFRAENHKGDRYDGVGEEEPKASDHCPVYIDIDLV